MGRDEYGCDHRVYVGCFVIAALYLALNHCYLRVASNPGFPFRILSRSFETKSGTESLGSRLIFGPRGGVSRKFWSGENFGPGDQNSRKIWSAGLLFSENIGSLEPRFSVLDSPKLRDKIRNGKPGFKAKNIGPRVEKSSERKYFGVSTLMTQVCVKVSA